MLLRGPVYLKYDTYLPRRVNVNLSKSQVGVMCDSSVSVEPGDIVLEGSSAQRSHFSPSLNYEAVQNRKSSRPSTMREIGFPKRIVSLITALYSKQQCAIRTDMGTIDRLHGLVLAKACDRTGLYYVASAISVFTESIMREVKEEQSNSEYDFGWRNQNY